MTSTAAIKQHIELLLQFLEPLLSFANCHMVDFFTHSSYKSHIPFEIQNEIDRVGLRHSIENIFKNNFSETPNIQNFIENTSRFTLRNSDICLNVDSFINLIRSWGCDNLEKFKLEIFMNAKKSHEVEILSAIAAEISKISKTECVVDIGDGKGYLSSMLALHNKIEVLGIDASNTNTCGALKRASKLSKIWKNLPNNPHKSHPKKTENFSSSNIELYKQITEYVDEDFNLEKLVSDVFQKSSDTRIGLVGLHTCGNLAASSLKIFHKNDSIKSICNVGCCYHLITEKFDKNEPGDYFPMSQFLIEKQILIGRCARMIANQSVERVLHKKELPNITIFYRALLQLILAKYCTELPTNHVGKFRKIPESFKDYVRLATKRLDVNLAVTDQEIEDLYNVHQNRLDELNVFYLLRGRLSAVIESLILLDRILFLKEKGYENTFLVQLFDPVVSPRCYGIIALKDNL